MRINTSLIPEYEAKMLAMSFLDGIKKFYSNPENVKAFKEWQKQRNAEKLQPSS